MERAILNYNNLLDMLDDFLREPKEFWEDFYEDREKDIPFFKVQAPDENLVEYFNSGLKPNRVLEIGCGPGRNAIFMAQQGCKVDAIDISDNAIKWAKERAERAEVQVDFHCVSLFDYSIEPDTYDFIYDCGMLHHLPPHRRLTYLETIKSALKKDGHLGLVCFTTDGALDTSDWDIYKHGSLRRGIGYTEDRLKEVFAAYFEIKSFRKMKKIEQPSHLFGEDFLWVSLMKVKK
ncbi:class I SAM-dependent methyltransferase [Bacillus carboniphilus]|uniref:Class I SAM-dependent methyltransferase n=1 Tax=Bacillus carboniphilus TaxID=86663 RepID=A0ABN0WJB9_9BACI